MRVLQIAILCIGLAGCNHPVDCATDFYPHDDCLPGTLGYENRQKQINQLKDAQMSADRSEEEKCRSYGLTFGTPAYAQCRQNFVLARPRRTNTNCMRFGPMLDCTSN